MENKEQDNKSFKINSSWLQSLGFSEISELDEDIHSSGFIYYDDKARGGIYLAHLPETHNVLFIYKFFGENESGKRDMHKLVDGMQINSDDEFYFVMQRLGFTRHVFQLPVNRIF